MTADTATAVGFILVALFWLIVISVLGFLIWHYWNYDEYLATLKRCEKQHQQWMSGDDHGFYGDYPPADFISPGWRAPEDLPCNLDRSDRGKSWKCHDGLTYLWTGTHYTRTLN